MGARLVLGLLVGCFFLSGLAALIYQTAWTRQFAFPGFETRQYRR